MKRISIILLIFVLMGISFAGIGLLILYVSGTVTSVDDARRLLSEEPAQIRESTVDGVEVLEQQKDELAGELARTKRTIEALQSLSGSLSNAAKSGSNLSMTGPDLARVSGVVSGMDDETAANTLVALDQSLSLELLKQMPQQRASDILRAIEDAPTRVKLINAMAGK
jgi:flagellar motility protein MotE (MotC chaperone)